MKQPTVLVVEDEPSIAELIMVNLRHHGYQTRWAADGVQAQRMLLDQMPDLILLDWMLPGENGVALARRWRKDARSRDVPIIMLTARSEEADRVAGLDAGADDYLAKPFSTRELLARMRAVLRRRAPEQIPVTLTLADLSLDELSQRVSFRGQAIKLGPTEYRLLNYLMRHPERVHSRAQLLDKVWGAQVLIEDRTVDVHIKRLREALGEGAAMVETVRGSGYRLTQQGTASARGDMA